MILLLLFLQKQSLAFAVYLFGIGTLHTVHHANVRLADRLTAFFEISPRGMKGEEKVKGAAAVDDGPSRTKWRKPPSSKPGDGAWKKLLLVCEDAQFNIGNMREGSCSSALARVSPLRITPDPAVQSPRAHSALARRRLVSNALFEPSGTQSSASSRFRCELCNIVFATAQV